MGVRKHLRFQTIRRFQANNSGMPVEIKTQRDFLRSGTEDKLVTSSDSNRSFGTLENMPKCSLLKSVSFTSVEIREYNVIVGDHPCCVTGFPLTLDWEYRETENIELEKYEQDRSPRRHKDELKISPEERCQLISDESSAVDLRKAQRQLHRARSCSAKLCERVNAKFFN